MEPTAAEAQRAPTIVAVVARLVPHAKCRQGEELVAAGCAAQHLCLAATAFGYGSMWRTGRLPARRWSSRISVSPGMSGALVSSLALSAPLTPRARRHHGSFTRCVTWASANGGGLSARLAVS